MGDSLKEDIRQIRMMVRLVRIYLGALARIAQDSTDPASKTVALRALADARSFCSEHTIDTEDDAR